MEQRQMIPRKKVGCRGYGRPLDILKLLTVKAIIK